MTKSRKLQAVFLGVATAALALSSGTGIAAAGEEPQQPGVDGQVSTTQEFEITPGSGPVNVSWKADAPRPGEAVPFAEYGSSYARSTESAFINYTGRAKAAANVFQGSRIIRVTIQYNRLRYAGGPDEVVGAPRSSFATCPSSFFAPGPEVTTTATDSFGLSDPPTRFIVGLGRVPTGQRCG